MAKQFIATTLMDGYVDGPHITEVQTGIANQGLYGPDDYVLDEGKKAEAQILTNNSVRVFDATFVIQGRRDVMAANAYADVTIANGEQGMYRNDIIVRKYEKDEMAEIENTSFDVIKGTPSSGVATDPEIPTGDIRTGATMHNMALYRVKLEGLNIVALEPMFKVLYNMADIKKELESLNGNIIVDMKEDEFLTNETYLGQPVYGKYIDIKKIAIQSYIPLNIPDSFFWIDTGNSYVYPISQNFDTMYPFPYVNPQDAGSSIRYALSKKNKSIMLFGGDWTGYGLYLLVKYYKY